MPTLENAGFSSISEQRTRRRTPLAGFAELGPGIHQIEGAAVTVNTNKYKVHVYIPEGEQREETRPLVLLGGAVDTVKAYEELAKNLAKRRNSPVILVEKRTIKNAEDIASDATANDTAAEGEVYFKQQAQDIHTILRERLQIPGKMDIIAHSFSTLVAAHLALTHPDSWSSVVLGAPVGLERIPLNELTQRFGENHQSVMGRRSDPAQGDRIRSVQRNALRHPRETLHKISALRDKDIRKYIAEGNLQRLLLEIAEQGRVFTFVLVPRNDPYTKVDIGSLQKSVDKAISIGMQVVLFLRPDGSDDHNFMYADDPGRLAESLAILSDQIDEFEDRVVAQGRS